MSPRYRYHPGTRLALLQADGTLTIEDWEAGASSEVGPFMTVRQAAELSKDTRVPVQGFADLAVALQWLLGLSDRHQISALMRWIDETE